MAQQSYDHEPTNLQQPTSAEGLVASRIFELFAGLKELDGVIPVNMTPVTAETRPRPEYTTVPTAAQLTNEQTALTTQQAPEVPPPLPDNIVQLSQHVAQLARSAEEGLRNVA